MTADELDEFFEECPVLYHMAMHDSWPLIQEHGLLPTDRLLDLFEVSDEERAQLTKKRRPSSVDIEHSDIGRARIRDQIPLTDSDLERCLTGGLTPEDWHRKLNERIFFWTNRERLYTLMCARAYRTQKHLVLEVPAQPIFEAYSGNIELCSMNSGCTKPFAHPRGPETFQPIVSYSYAERRRRSRRGDRVVEVTVIGGIPDITRYIVKASIKSCAGGEAVVYQADE